MKKHLCHLCGGKTEQVRDGNIRCKECGFLIKIGEAVRSEDTQYLLTLQPHQNQITGSGGGGGMITVMAAEQLAKSGLEDEARLMMGFPVIRKI